MPSKKISLAPIQLTKDENGNFSSSVSVATPNALVVIENLVYIDENTLMAYVVVTEDEQDE